MSQVITKKLIHLLQIFLHVRICYFHESDMFIWTFHFEITINPQAAVKNIEILCILYPVSPNGNILLNYYTISPPRYWDCHNPPIKFRFPQFLLYSLCVGGTFLYNLITCVGWCIYHHTQDTGIVLRDMSCWYCQEEGPWPDKNNSLWWMVSH